MSWHLFRHKKGHEGDFPGGAVVENLPANAGDTGSSPGLGRSHVPQSNWAREPQLLCLRVWSLCSATREATTVRGPRTAVKSGPHLPQLEKALAQKWRANTAINKQTNKQTNPKFKKKKKAEGTSAGPNNPLWVTDQALMDPRAEQSPSPAAQISALRNGEDAESRCSVMGPDSSSI